MNKDASGGLREEARKWTCHNFAITEHGGDAAALLRKAADAIEELEDIEILDVTFQLPDSPALELTVSVYFYFRSEPEESAASRRSKGKSRVKRKTRA